MKTLRYPCLRTTAHHSLAGIDTLQVHGWPDAHDVRTRRLGCSDCVIVEGWSRAPGERWEWDTSIPGMLVCRSTLVGTGAKLALPQSTDQSPRLLTVWVPSEHSDLTIKVS